MPTHILRNGTIVLPDRLLSPGMVRTENGRITGVDSSLPGLPADAEGIDLGGGYLVPGFVDLHVHGGAGADFIDGTDDALRTLCRRHARHRTTSLMPTTTVHH